MKRIKVLLTILVVLAVIFGATMILQPRADAATANPTTGSTSYQMNVVPISAVTTTTAAIVKIPMPWPQRVTCMYAVATDVTGTVLLDLVNAAGTSLLSSKVTVSTVPAEATLTATTANLSITDESWIAINTSSTGTADHVTVNICTKRL